ncbi:hypothetical protein V8C35DRAFT_287451 [Trichoderma chlorosporum]
MLRPTNSFRRFFLFLWWLHPARYSCRTNTTLEYKQHLQRTFYFVHGLPTVKRRFQPAHRPGVATSHSTLAVTPMTQ